MDTVPRPFRKQVSTARSILALHGEDLPWSSILTLASQYDNEQESATESEADGGSG